MNWESEVTLECIDAGAGDLPDLADSILGPSGAHVSPEFHSQMVAMAEKGAIPRTTLRQRELIVQTTSVSKGCTVSTPGVYTQALHKGYISPLLPPPAGYIWKAVHGSWRLCMRGG